MFDLIAPRYDDFTRRFSFGMDKRWKRDLLRRAAAAVSHGGRVADVAAGTGDLAVRLARLRPDIRVTALDISPRMLELAEARRHREGADNVSVAAADLAALGIASGSCDAVTAGYALRNAPSWEGALAELARVLRPGGHLLTLDFHRPESRAWRTAFLQWLWLSGRFVGWLWHREPMAYGYIARSIDHFVSADRFATGLATAGFDVVAVRRYLGGGVAIHHAVRR
jgi:demethylmenaquinone methyltransferase/2-methoxy-6-polyprenyl-1,4-benzoquinol methylase